MDVVNKSPSSWQASDETQFNEWVSIMELVSFAASIIKLGG